MSPHRQTARFAHDDCTRINAMIEQVLDGECPSCWADLDDDDACPICHVSWTQWTHRALQSLSRKATASAS